MEFISNWSCPTVLELIAILFLIYWLLYLPGKLKAKWLLNNCCAAWRSKKILTPRPNDYAVITGSTDGIGLEYAKQLAEKGYNLVLLSRTEEKLKQVAAEIQEQYPQAKKIEILEVDFTRTDIYERIQRKLESLNGQIKVLVNNVGMAYHATEFFTQYPDGFHLNLINANIVSVTSMSEIVLRIMCKQTVDPKCKNHIKGVVINVSSFAGMTEYPLMSTYSASKAYVNFLGKILATEHAQDGIIIQTLTPNQVEFQLETNMIKQLDQKHKQFAVPASDIVRYALKTVGSEQQSSAHPKHKLLNNLFMAIGSLVGDNLFMKMKFSRTKQSRVNQERKVTPEIKVNIYDNELKPCDV